METKQENQRLGLVTKYILKGGYGFIETPIDDKVFFFHSSNVKSSCPRPRLSPGELVEFTISEPKEKGEKKLCMEAIDLKSPPNKPFLCDIIHQHKKSLNLSLQLNKEIKLKKKEEPIEDTEIIPKEKDPETEKEESK